MSRSEDIAREEARVRELQRAVDLVLFYIARGPIGRLEAQQLVERVREKALDLFPDKGDTFDLIYHPRFMRAINERFGAL